MVLRARGRLCLFPESDPGKALPFPLVRGIGVLHMANQAHVSSLCSLTPFIPQHMAVSRQESLIANVNCAGIPDSLRARGFNQTLEQQPPSRSRVSILLSRLSSYPVSLSSNPDCKLLMFVLRMLPALTSGSSRIFPETNNHQAMLSPLWNIFPSLPSSQSNNLLTFHFSASSTVCTRAEKTSLSSFQEIHPRTLRLVLL